MGYFSQYYLDYYERESDNFEYLQDSFNDEIVLEPKLHKDSKSVRDMSKFLLKGSYYYDKDYTIVGYKGNSANLVFPSLVDGIYIKKIGGEFDNTISSIRLPQHLQCINEKTFQNLTNLRNVKINPLLIDIKKSSFKNTGLRTLDFGKACASIEEYAFSNCTDLKRIYGKKVSYIGECSFSNCTNLEYISLGAFNVSKYAFSECINLKIAFLESCNYISKFAFINCFSLRKVYLSRDTYVETDAFMNCPDNLQIFYC